MTTCITILGIITCTLNPQATKLSPDQAAAILAPGQYVHVTLYPARSPADLFFWPNAPALPTPRPGPARRLDGSRHADPPWTTTSYGSFDPRYPSVQYVYLIGQRSQERQRERPQRPTEIYIAAQASGKPVRLPR